MKLSDVVRRGREKRSRGATGPARYFTALKGRSGLLIKCLGETQDEADAAWLERIRARFCGEYIPFILTFREETVLAWREGDSWAYGYIHTDQTTPSAVILGAWSARDEVARHARLSLAMRVWDDEEETSPVILNAEDQQTFSSWARTQKRFQRAYRFLREHGWSDHEAHSMSGGDFSHIAPQRIAQLGDPRTLLREAGIATL